MPTTELQAVHGPSPIHGEVLFGSQGIFKNLDLSGLGLLGLVWFSTFHFYFILICKFVELNPISLWGKKIILICHQCVYSPATVTG